MFGLFGGKAKRKEAIEKYGKILLGNVIDAYHEVGIRLGRHPPYLIDEISPTDLYLLGYLQALMICLEKQAPELSGGFAGVDFSAAMLTTLFGQGQHMPLTKLASQSRRDPRFEKGMEDGVIEGMALMGKQPPRGLLRQHLQQRR